MNEHFRQHVESLHAAFEALKRCPAFSCATLPKELPSSGIYLFSEDDRPLYVGRTNSLRRRLQQHSRASSSHNSAPFAFRLARQACNVERATYRQEGSRAHLMQDPAFMAAFSAALNRIRSMQVRVVEEPNSLGSMSCARIPFRHISTTSACCASW